MFLERLDGRSLITFLTVLEAGSISRAAERLGYVQSTVTSQIQQLEQSCGRRLFHRRPRGVIPTEAGETLAVYVREFLHLGQLLEEALGSFDEPRGVVRVRALESFCVTRLSDFLHDFFTEFPGITLHLETGFKRISLNGQRAMLWTSESSPSPLPAMTWSSFPS